MIRLAAIVETIAVPDRGKYLSIIQEALLREKKDRWTALDSILKRKPVSEGAIDEEFNRIANAIRKGIDNRHYFEEQLRRLETNRELVALKRDDEHHEANCRIYNESIKIGLERIR